MKKIITLTACMAGLLGGISASAGDYRPMLEQGKTWKYTLVDHARRAYPTWKPDRPVEHLRETRLEGYETINGETYMKLIVYYDGSDTPAESNPLYYLREDTETGKVYFYPHRLFSPEEGIYDYLDDGISWENEFVQDWIYRDWSIDGAGLMYDFYAADGRNFGSYQTGYESTVTLPDGEHRCLIIDDWYNDTNARVIEGIGLTTDDTNYGGSILEASMCTHACLPDSYYRSFLYEVVSGDGEIIYSDDSFRPGWWQSTDALKDIVAEAKVHVGADGIAVTGAPDAEACLFDMQGRLLSRHHTENGCLSISTAGIPAGVYVLRLGSRSYKIAIR